MKKSLIALLALMAMLAVACAGVCDSLYVDNRETDRIHPERLNLRAEPSKNGAILGLYYTGAQVEASGTQDDYTKVEIGGVTGYMASEYLITAEEAESRYGKDSGFGQCRAARVDLGGLWESEIDLLEDTDPASKPVCTLRHGDEVRLIGILDESWAYIAAQNGDQEVHGYVRLDTLIDVLGSRVMIVAAGKADSRTILYDAPNNKAKEILSLKNGTPCLALFGRKEGNWVKVRVGGVTGWIKYTQAGNLEPLAEGQARGTVPYYPLVMQTKTDALLFSVQGDKGRPYMTLGADMKVEVLAETKDSVYVRTMDGGAGAYDCGDYGFMALSDLALSRSEGGVGIAQADDDDLPVVLLREADEKAQMLGALIPGAQARIVDFTQTDYVQIALGDVTGYVLKSQIRALGEGSEPATDRESASDRIPQRAAMLSDGVLRSGMAEDAGETARVQKGERVYMLAVCGDWAFVKAGDSPEVSDAQERMGFVRLAELNAPASTTHLTAHVTKDKINMREQASKDSQIIGRARLGERLRVADYGTEWTCVVTPAGKRGYVMNTYLEFE